MNNPLFEWTPTAWQKLQREENTPKSLRWHLKLAQDESILLKERCEYALQAFLRRQRASLKMVLLGVISVTVSAAASFILMVARIDAWVPTLISCLVVIVYSPLIHDWLLGAYAARQIALRIKRSLESDSDEPYLPSQSLLHGRYRLLLRSPWFCEVPEKSGEDTELKDSTFKSWMSHRSWIDVVPQSMAPKPCAMDLSLRTATDPNCAAQERAEAALFVFSKRTSPVEAVVIALFALIMGGINLFPAMLILRHNNSLALLALWIVVVCCTFCANGSLLIAAFKQFLRALVASHIKTRIQESLSSPAALELSLSSECAYYVPSNALLCKGFKLVRTYPYYEELEEDVQDVQDVQDAKCEPKDVKFHEGK